MADAPPQPQIDSRALEIAAMAMATVSSHEKTCAERQLSIITRFDESRVERVAFTLDVKESLRGIYSVLWKAVFGLVASLAAALMTLLFKLGHF